METAFLTVLGLVAGLVLQPFLSEYAKAKGKNQADKDDIKLLTALVEGVKHENQLILEEIRSRQQLRVVAAERRLQAHQEAHTLWRKLWRAMHSQDVPARVLECAEWWDNNSLYLSPQARAAFHDATWAANDHAGLLGGDRSHVAEISKNMDRIRGAGSLIVAAVELPSLGDAETSLLK